jgi:hypothetical protein
MNIKKKTDITGNNLDELIRLYDKYRQMQYDIFKQYNLLLEDPRFDDLYMDITPLTHYRGYIEADLNGTPEHSSTTDIIKEFKKLKETYNNVKVSYDSKDKYKQGDTLIN